MKCAAFYSVVYRGNLYSAGEPFDIKSEDSAEMRKHGKVWGEETKHDAKEEPVVKRTPGRPRKNSS